MLLRVSPTNQGDARTAADQGSRNREVMVVGDTNGGCIRPFVQSVVLIQRFHLNLERTDPFTVALALARLGLPTGKNLPAYK